MMAQIGVWVGGCGWSLGRSVMGCMIVRWLDRSWLVAGLKFGGGFQWLRLEFAGGFQ